MHLRLTSQFPETHKLLACFSQLSECADKIDMWDYSARLEQVVLVRCVAHFPGRSGRPNGSRG